MVEPGIEAYRENCILWSPRPSGWVFISERRLSMTGEPYKCPCSSRKPLLTNLSIHTKQRGLKSCGSRGGRRERRHVVRRCWTKCCPYRLPCCAFSLVVRALSDCVYFAEGRFTSGSLWMNGELISPTETSQSLHIYSPPFAVTSPQPSEQWLPSKLQMGLTQREPLCISHINTASKAQWNQRKNIKLRPGGHFLMRIQYNKVWSTFPVKF